MKNKSNSDTGLKKQSAMYIWNTVLILHHQLKSKEYIKIKYKKILKKKKKAIIDN